MFEQIWQQINSLNRQVVTAYERGEYERGIPLAQQACNLAKPTLARTMPTMPQACIIWRNCTLQWGGLRMRNPC
jgi:hypothetical protein